MTHFICAQCGVQFDNSVAPPAHCPICRDERQFVRWEGQAWTDMAALGRDHRLVWRDDAGVLGIGMEPAFAIGQRALLIEEPDGCILWDCTSLVTPDIIAAIGSRGGLKAIAISHPHFYSAMVEWSEAFGGVPIYLHADDRAMGHAPKPVDRVLGRRYAPAVGCRDADPLRRAFRRQQHAALGDGAAGAGALFIGDSAQVTMDRSHVSFMYSYPNIIPLGAAAVRRIASAIEPFSFDRIHGGWWDRNIVSGARAAFDRSVARYLAAVG